jgi:hypothetical protein
MTDIVEDLRLLQSGAAWVCGETAATLEDAAHEIERLRLGYTTLNSEVCQCLGKALGYPWYKDDQENFPGATEDSGVCAGDHVAETIAAEAARQIGNLEAERDRLRSGFLMAMQYDNKCRQTGQPCDAPKLCACFLETEGWCDAPKEAGQ